LRITGAEKVGVAEARGARAARVWFFGVEIISITGALILAARFGGVPKPESASRKAVLTATAREIDSKSVLISSPLNT
jgi:hypothetical protein